MKSRRIGNYAIVLLVVVNILLWLIFPPPNDNRPHFLNQYIGEIFSTSGLILFSCGIFLAARPRFLEPFFGGLDKMYRTHKNAAIFAFSFILAHFFTMGFGSGFHLNVSLGKIAMIGFIIWILFALAPRIPFVGNDITLPYHTWRFTHRFVGLFFITGLVHHFRVQNLLQTTPIVRIYVLTIAFAAVAVYLYKEFLYDRVRNRFAYHVAGARRLSGNTLEITLKPLKKTIHFNPGQFLFVHFLGDKKLGEPHPFSISSAPRSEEIKLAVKASGDFTRYLHQTLQAGTEARLDGGYGMFNYKSGSRQQLWVAGGIGLTPFLSWIRDFQPGPLGYEIDFFYSVRTLEEALYLEEIQPAAAAHPEFRFYLICSNSEGPLTGDRIIAASGPVANKEIYLCGPLGMTLALKRQLIAAGARAGSFHYEEFNFR
jgi:predicted ferric reductase